MGIRPSFFRSSMPGRTAVVSTVVLGVVVVLAPSGVAQVDPHAYFDALVTRPDTIFSRSLRAASQLSGAWTYDAAFDAAKGVVPVGDGTSDANVGGHGVSGQMRFRPPVIGPGDDVVYTWDGLWGPEWANKANLGGLKRHKAFQITQADYKYIELAVDYDEVGNGDVADVNIRPYGFGVEAPPLGSGYSISGATIVPQRSPFIIKPSRWTRFWLRIERRAVNQFSLMSLWVADEQTNPVQVYRQVPIQAVQSDVTEYFWFEFNTSQKRNVGAPALTTYQRNFVILRGLGDPTPILQRPLASTPPPTPQAPQNLRVTVP